jgi:hypothetical protein
LTRAVTSDEADRPLTATERWAVVSPALRAAAVPFLVTRVMAFAAIGIARLVAGGLHLGSAARAASRSDLLGWDASWYEKIAAQGYSGLSSGALRFFPLLPVLARSFKAVPGMTAGMSVLIVANVGCFAAFAALYHLVKLEFGDEACARRAVWLLALAPPAFVLVMGYAESLLLLTSILAFLGLRQRHYGLAICAGFLAGLSRPVGMLLAIPAAIELAASWRSSSGRGRAPGIGAVLAAPAGAAAYLGWADEGAGSFLAPLREQLSVTHRGVISDPFVTLGRDAWNLVHGSHFGTTEHALWAILLVALAVVIFRKLPAAYGWYAASVLVVVLTASNFDSLERFGLGCFPFVIAAATLTRGRTTYWIVAGLSALLFMTYAILAFIGVYVP